MKSFVFKRDYPPLHQSWRDLVLCGLITPKMFSEINFFSHFINYKSFGRKLSEENSLFCLVPQQERFSEKWQYHFFHIFVTFLQFLTFLRQYKPCKEPLVIRLEMICRTQMYLTSKDTSTPWTSCRYNVIFPIIYPPPLHFESQSGKGLYCVHRKSSNPKR